VTDPGWLPVALAALVGVVGGVLGWMLLATRRSVRQAERRAADRAAALLVALLEREDTAREGLADEVGLLRTTYSVLDTETTGLHVEGEDRVVSVAVVQLVGGRVRPQEAIHELVDPGRPIPPQATAVHGINEAMVQGAPALVDVLPRVASFVQGSVLVGHNLPFDLRGLTPTARQAGVALPSETLDTVALSRLVEGPDAGRRTLDAVAERLRVPVHDRHTALGDALVTAEVLRRLLVLAAAQGLATWDDLHAAIADERARWRRRQRWRAWRRRWWPWSRGRHVRQTAQQPPTTTTGA
jgi:DNA polymerase III epsilon subunit family exonuclease